MLTPSAYSQGKDAPEFRGPGGPQLTPSPYSQGKDVPELRGLAALSTSSLAMFLRGLLFEYSSLISGNRARNLQRIVSAVGQYLRRVGSLGWDLHDEGDSFRAVMGYRIGQPSQNRKVNLSKGNSPPFESLSRSVRGTKNDCCRSMRWHCHSVHALSEEWLGKLLRCRKARSTNNLCTCLV